MTTSRFLALVLLSAFALAQDSSFELVDSNNNNVVDEAELSAFLRKSGRRDGKEMMARFDQDRDGVLDISEFVPLVYDLGRQPVDLAYQFFKKMDKNDDGVVDKTEVQLSRTESDGRIIDGLLSMADINEDGQLTYEEFKSQLGGQQQKPKADQDREAALRLLSFMDTNGDNRVDESELLSFANKSPVRQNRQETMRAFKARGFERRRISFDRRTDETSLRLRCFHHPKTLKFHS
ncbi:unnamed protein product [Caenorhabditis auriculariae]|uniref:EF-hand domain-containing protein n=1 Tax=Caenorhabditis auriculariae TaxID=2777116 RepID=A0A8S1H084_9PELO|nr:unnamed protein product [Caenorhabditis auriculariae]